MKRSDVVMQQGVLLLVILVTGCAGENGRPQCHPVTGKVLLKGKPAFRAVVTFHPLQVHADGRKYTASTFTDDQGEFCLTTFDRGDGTPVGEYAVTIIAGYESKNGQDVAVPDFLRGRYKDEKTTLLKVRVQEGRNDLDPWDLRSR